jgi:hypothetical protein
MSALPKAVQRQVDAANKIASDIKAGKVVAGNDPKTGQVVFEDTPPDGTPPAAPPAGSPPVAAPPSGNATVVPAGAPVPEEAWEKRYKVLQGKYNAEIPRLTTQVRDQSNTINDMRSQLTAMQGMMSTLAQRGAPAAPAAPPASAPAATGGKLVKDEEVKSFGADLIDVIRRVAREEMHPHMSQFAPVASRVAQVEQSVQNVSTRVVQNDQQKFVSYVLEHVPDYEQQNVDEGFIAWLDKTDPYIGRTRQSLLEQAANALDGPRVVAFFKGYQNEHAAVTPPAGSAPPAQPAAPAAPAQPAATPNPLDRFVAPGAARAGAGGTPNEGQKRIWTRTEINDFEQRRNSFVRRGKKVPDNLVQMERDIFAAAAEGRVSG